MNGFENIKERVELREKFKNETGDNWENSQGEPDIDYVLWLESKLFAIPDVVLSLPDEEAIEQWWAEGKESEKFWQEAPYRTNGDVVEEIKTALKYFITVWQ